MEDALFDDLAVQSGHTVDFVRPDHGEIRHLDLSVRNNGKIIDKAVLPGETVPQVIAESAVDLLNDHVDTRQTAGNKILLHVSSASAMTVWLV